MVPLNYEHCAKLGRFDEAVATASEAMQLARRTGKRALAERLRGQYASYMARKPLRLR